MRARNIKPGFFRNAQLMQIPPLGRLLFAGLWCLADREGRLYDRPTQIKWDVLPADDCDVNALLDDLATSGFIHRYCVDGTHYIEVVNFLRHQHPHYKEAASTLPPPTISPSQNSPSTRLIPDCGYSDCGYSDSLHSPAQSSARSEAIDTASRSACPDDRSPDKRGLSVPVLTDIQAQACRIATLWSHLAGKTPTKRDTKLIERALTQGYGEDTLTALLHAKHLEYHTARSKKNFTLANLLGAKLPHHLSGLVPARAPMHRTDSTPAPSPRIASHALPVPSPRTASHASPVPSSRTASHASPAPSPHTAAHAGAPTKPPASPPADRRSSIPRSDWTVGFFSE